MVPKPSSSHRQRAGLPGLVALFLLVSSLPLWAFPPAPPTTLYGIVRGEFGYALQDGNTDLLLLGDGVEVARTTIQDLGVPHENYRLALPIDLNPSIGTYKPGTVSGDPEVEYVLVAERGGIRIPVLDANTGIEGFVPNPGGLFRLDLSLGTDTDGDALPDAWERFQVLSGGPVQEDPLTLLFFDGDFDGDGLTDWEEYVAGTFAFLFSDSLSFRIVDVGADGLTEVEFLAVDGKTYTIECSDQVGQWRTVEFETIANTPLNLGVFRAAATQMEHFRIKHPASTERKFYRLRVN